MYVCRVTVCARISGAVLFELVFARQASSSGCVRFALVLMPNGAESGVLFGGGELPSWSFQEGNSLPVRVNETYLLIVRVCAGAGRMMGGFGLGLANRGGQCLQRRSRQKNDFSADGREGMGSHSREA